MTEDKRPEFRKAETPKKEFTQRHKIMKTWYETKFSLGLCIFLIGCYTYYANGDLGLLTQWYIAIPIIVFISFGPISPPDPEYKK